MKIFTEKEFEEQLEESRQQGEIFYNKNGFDRFGRSWNSFGEEYFWEVQLRPGLYLCFDDDYVRVPLYKEAIHDCSMTCLVSKFYLSGVERVLTPGIAGVPQEYEEKGKYNYLWFLPNLREIEISPANQRSRVLKIKLDLNLFRSFGIEINLLPSQLQLLLESNCAPRFHRTIGRITPIMQTTLQQILNCPYQGLTKRMYLEAKSLELVALQISQWQESENQTLVSGRWSSDEVERLHHARDILLQELHNPPSLLTLARQVGLNDFKLKKGFRHVFGTTVFGCLQQRRMELAKQLLEQRNLSIAAIAHQIGYASQSHFCQMFKQQFGVTPNAYRKTI
jgi:AraC family transcriptional regulator, transcriptional activator of the genes for pyochelin and ferripyochelin receptors